MSITYLNSHNLNLHFHFRSECQDSINGYARARYKKFATESEAKEFVQENAANCPVVDRRETQKKDDDNGAALASRECPALKCIFIWLYFVF